MIDQYRWREGPVWQEVTIYEGKVKETVSDCRNFFIELCSGGLLLVVAFYKEVINLISDEKDVHMV